LYSLVKKHADETNSSHAKKIIQQWPLEKDRFVQICPKEMLNKLKYPITNKVHLKDQAS
jgi:glutamate synthase (NADPH/NADH) large chain